MDELKPLMTGLTQEPLAFLGGFVSGLLRLNLSDDPVKTWLDRQTGNADSATSCKSNNGSSTGPQSIMIE